MRAKSCACVRCACVSTSACLRIVICSTEFRFRFIFYSHTLCRDDSSILYAAVIFHIIILCFPLCIYVAVSDEHEQWEATTMAAHWSLLFLSSVSFFRSSHGLSTSRFVAHILCFDYVSLEFAIVARCQYQYRNSADDWGSNCSFVLTWISDVRKRIHSNKIVWKWWVRGTFGEKNIRNKKYTLLLEIVTKSLFQANFNCSFLHSIRPERNDSRRDSSHQNNDSIRFSALAIVVEERSYSYIRRAFRVNLSKPKYK